jgi:hypothetical protein
MSGADRINCSLHGDSEVTIVCLHIVETLHDRAARGFWWALDDDGEYQATCTLCHEMDRDEFDARVRELGRVLCFSCYCDAARLNGVEIVGRA